MWVGPDKKKKIINLGTNWVQFTILKITNFIGLYFKVFLSVGPGQRKKFRLQKKISNFGNARWWALSMFFSL